MIVAKSPSLQSRTVACSCTVCCGQSERGVCSSQCHNLTTNAKSLESGNPTPIRDSVATHIRDPVAMPIRDPAATHIRDPVATPIRDPVATPIRDPVATPIRESPATPIHNSVNAGSGKLHCFVCGVSERPVGRWSCTTPRGTSGTSSGDVSDRTENASAYGRFCDSRFTRTKTTNTLLRDRLTLICSDSHARRCDFLCVRCSDLINFVDQYEMEVSAAKRTICKLITGVNSTETASGVSASASTFITSERNQSNNYNQLTAGNSQLTTGNSQLTAGNSQLTAGNSQLTAGNSQLTAGNSQLTAGNSQLTAGNSQLTAADNQLSCFLSQNFPSCDFFNNGIEETTGFDGFSDKSADIGSTSLVKSGDTSLPQVTAEVAGGSSDGMPNEASTPFHSCDVCSRAFSTEQGLSIHQRIHSKSSGQRCRFCSKMFSTRARVMRHVQRVHSSESSASNVSKERHHCDHCGKSFATADQRNTHAKFHASQRPLACTLCNLTFVQKGDLSKHMRTHNGERPYVCSVCQKRFARSDALKAHEVVHSGEKSFRCDDCGRTFAQRGNLNRHRIIHTGDLPYNCDVCQQRFRRREQLNIHRVRLHRDNSPDDAHTEQQKL